LVSNSSHPTTAAFEIFFPRLIRSSVRERLSSAFVGIRFFFACGRRFDFCNSCSFPVLRAFDHTYLTAPPSPPQHFPAELAGAAVAHFRQIVSFFSSAATVHFLTMVLHVVHPYFFFFAKVL